MADDNRPVLLQHGEATLSRASISAAKRALLVVALMALTLLPTRAATVIVTPGATYQTITGWEAHSQSGELSPNFALWSNTLFDAAVNDLGINRLRLEIVSGAENPVDAYTQWRSGAVAQSTWQAARYASVNDNPDPFVANPNGFHFAMLDDRMDRVVLPMRQRLQARGERLYVNLNYVDFATTTFEHFTNPQEYAELMLVTFQHLQARYGFVPDAIEVILEPGNANNLGWTGPIIGQVIVATGKRLAAAGFNPDFIAPSHTNQTSAITFFDQLIQVPGVPQYLTEFAYHLYGGVSDANRTTIGNRAVQYSLRTSMLEHIASGYEDLHRDLKLARVSAWQQYTLGFPDIPDNGAQFFLIDSASGAVRMSARAKYLRQYFKYVRAGAVRVGATGTTTFDPLAFRNPDGALVVVVRATGGGTFTIGGLPAGRYGSVYTVGASDSSVTTDDAPLPDQTITVGQDVTVTMPSKGIVTVYAQSGGAGPAPPTKLRIVR